MVMRMREVDARSEAYSRAVSTYPTLKRGAGIQNYLTRLLLEDRELLDGGLEICLWFGVLAGGTSTVTEGQIYFGESFGFGNLLVGILGEVLLRLQRGVRHLEYVMSDGGYDMVWWWLIVVESRVEMEALGKLVGAMGKGCNGAPRQFASAWHLLQG